MRLPLPVAQDYHKVYQKFLIKTLELLVLIAVT